MAGNYWAKFWLEILDDPKVAQMSDWLFRKFTYFILVAKEHNQGGCLPPVKDLAWRIRGSTQEVMDALLELRDLGISRKDEKGWYLVNFAKRQDREISDSAVRMRRLRAKKNKKSDISDVTSDASPSDLISSDSPLLSSVSSSASDSDLLEKFSQFPTAWVQDAIFSARKNKAHNQEAYVSKILQNRQLAMEANHLEKSSPSSQMGNLKGKS